MKVKVDREACQGHALCAHKAPEVFSLDEEGYSASDGRIVPPTLEAQARKGMEYCPEHAITLVEDQ